MTPKDILSTAEPFHPYSELLSDEEGGEAEEGDEHEPSLADGVFGCPQCDTAVYYCTRCGVP